MTATRPILAVIVLLVAAGCTTERRAFPEHTSEQVWTAMKVAAERPEYPDWVVTQNGVYVDEPDRRIEIYRELRRDRWMPEAPPDQERALWEITLRLEDDKGVPTVSFVSRNPAIPADAQAQGARVLDEVEYLLTGDEAFRSPPRDAEPPAMR